MTSGSILPSIGPPPPEFRRPVVPENLRPKLVSESGNDRSGQNPPVRADAARSGVSSENKQAAGTPQSTNEAESANQTNGAQSRVADQPVTKTVSNLGGTSAVVVQIQESSASNEAGSSEQANKLPGDLSEEEKAIVADLKARDREVRAHEQAHASVGGGYTGVPSYEYARGPDGVQYAVGGHVDIDVAEVPNDPAATIAKMEVVRAAALAPAQPSGQDRAVAAAAEAKAREAQAELNEQRRAEALGEEEGDNASEQASAVAGIGSEAGTNEASAVTGTGPAAAPAVTGPAGQSQIQEISLNLLV